MKKNLGLITVNIIVLIAGIVLMPNIGLLVVWMCFQFALNLIKLVVIDEERKLINQYKNIKKDFQDRSDMYIDDHGLFEETKTIVK